MSLRGGLSWTFWSVWSTEGLGVGSKSVLKVHSASGVGALVFV